MRPIPDVTRIGGPNLFVYRTRDEFVAQVKTLIDNPAIFHINLEKYSWKEKARQFETLLGSLQ
jgi:hypothetical protein